MDWNLLGLDGKINLVSVQNVTLPFVEGGHSSTVCTPVFMFVMHAWIHGESIGGIGQP